MVRDRNMTDEEQLQNYFNTIYCCDEYKQKIELFKKWKLKSSRDYEVFKGQNRACMFLLFVIYAGIFFLAIKGFLWTFLFALIPVFSLFILAGERKTSKKELKTAIENSNQADKAWEEIINKTPVPPLPEDKLNMDDILELLAIFKSKRADTFKEVLIIAEQDRQHRQLVAQQNALRAAAYQAQQEAAQAKREAAAAKAEAEYQRQEADYWRREEEYYRN